MALVVRAFRHDGRQLEVGDRLALPVELAVALAADGYVRTMGSLVLHRGAA